MHLRLAMTLFGLTWGGTVAVVQPVLSQPLARDRDVITRAELVESAQKNQDLFKAVRSLRPHFLRPPPGVRSIAGGGRTAAIQLYIDGNRQAELNTLLLIRTLDVEEVRYLNPGRAEDMYGITHSSGAVQVKLYRAPRPPPP